MIYIFLCNLDLNAKYHKAKGKAKSTSQEMDSIIQGYYCWINFSFSKSELWHKIRHFIIYFFFSIDLQDEIQAIRNKDVPTCVPVFSVDEISNPRAAPGEFFGFSSFVMKPKTEHGDFDLHTGTFTVKTAGNYLLNFSAFILLSSKSPIHEIVLGVNGEATASFLNESSVVGHQLATISVLLPLKSGDKVCICTNQGELYVDEEYNMARFFGILFKNELS